MSGDAEFWAQVAAEADAAVLAAACGEVDRLDHVGRTLLLACLLTQPGLPAAILDAVIRMRNLGQLPAALTVIQGGDR